MTEYWLISAPGDKTCQQTWDTLNNATKSGNLSVNYKFPIPDLKVRPYGIFFLLCVTNIACNILQGVFLVREKFWMNYQT